MNEKLHLTSEETVKSTETGSEKKSEKDSIKIRLKEIGAIALIGLIMIGAGDMYLTKKAKGPEVILDTYRVEDVVESGDTLEDLARNVQNEIFLEKAIVLDRNDKNQIKNEITDEITSHNSDGVNPGDKIITEMTRFKNPIDHVRNDFDVQIIDALEDTK